MDQRDIINSAISHIDKAKTEIENASRNNPNQSSLAELDLAYQSLNDSIRHCQAIFGPTTIKGIRKLYNTR
ncbi:hypothetical protein ASZ90_017126 [hydrocarbon metagenome]|uniref:Uncharacterized protein n=1 Tax=hydrocarbon metagenome TaxID=938273 RepID=A0A0W8E9V7_9ZZZZ